MVLLKCIAMMTVFYYPTHLYQWLYMLHISLLIYPMMQYSSTAPQTPSPKINQFVIGTQNKTMWLNEQCEYRINIAQGTGCDLHIKNLLFHQNGFCTITARSLLINWGNLLRKKNEIQPWNIQWIYLHNHCIPYHTEQPVSDKWKSNILKHANNKPNTALK